MPDEKVPGGGISPDDVNEHNAPGASETLALTEEQVADYTAKNFLAEAERDCTGDRGRQTLIGAMLLARSVIFAGFVIATAIRESSKSAS